VIVLIVQHNAVVYSSLPEHRSEFSSHAVIEQMCARAGTALWKFLLSQVVDS
jgi:hypothetical protein